jgi:cytochrome P450
VAVLAQRDLGALLTHLHAAYGPVVEAGVGPLRFVYLFGPEANEVVLSSAADRFRWREAFQALEVVDGPTALVLSDGEDHDRRRRLVQPAFAKRRVDAMAAVAVEEVDRTLDGWRPGRRLVAHAELRACVRRNVVRSLFGPTLGDRADEVGELLEPALAYVQRSPLRRIDVDLPGSAYRRARRSREATAALVDGEIARRRREGADLDATTDVLSALVAARGEDGEEALTDLEVRDQVLSVVAAGYDTTSAAAAWLVQALGSHPEVRREVEAEVRAALGGRPPTAEDLRRLPLVEGLVKEVLRLWPPGFVAPRRCVEDVEVAGHVVPAGRRILYSGYVSQRLPEVWGDPEVLRPGRWAPGQPEPTPYAYVPFGGGPRRCIGFALAMLELQVLAVRLLQRATWSLDRPDAGPTGLASMTPAGGVPITVGAAA